MGLNENNKIDTENCYGNGDDMKSKEFECQYGEIKVPEDESEVAKKTRKRENVESYEVVPILVWSA